MTWLNLPNRITMTRIFLVAPLVICLLKLNAGWSGWRYLALALFVLMSLSDALDGFLARRLNEETPLGRYLDPVGDKLLITCAVILLAIDATAVAGFRLPSWVPVIAIGKDLIVLIGFLLIYIATGQYFVRPRTLGKACTLIQLVTVGYCLAAPELDAIVPYARAIWAGLYGLASAAAVAALIDYVRIGNRFAADYLAAARK
jgi:cardiolipin synthase